jgi:hypothetical protein
MKGLALEIQERSWISMGGEKPKNSINGTCWLQVFLVWCLVKDIEMESWSTGCLDSSEEAATGQV